MSNSRVMVTLLMASLLLVVLGTTSVFAGGSKEASTVAAQPAAQPAGHVTISLWNSLMGSKAAARKQLIAGFEKKYPNITVKTLGFFSISKNNEKMLTAMAAGDPPDLGANHYYYVAQYASQGAVQSLDKYFTASGIDPSNVFLPAPLKINLYKGKLYGIPMYTSTRVIIYNTEMFKKAGLNPNDPPTTWPQLVQDAVKLTKWNGNTLETSGFLAPETNLGNEDVMNYFVQLLWQKGGHIFNAARNKVEFASPAGIAALQYYVSLFQKYKVSQIGFGAGTQGTQQPFYAGKAAMFMAGPYDIVSLRALPNLHYGVTPMPAPPGGRSVALVDSFSVFMPTQAKHKAAAWDFIKYASTKTAQVDFARSSARLPAVTAAANDPYFTQNPVLHIFAKAVATGRAIPIVPQWTQIQNTLTAEIQKALTGQISAKAALENVDNTVNSQILQ